MSLGRGKGVQVNLVGTTTLIALVIRLRMDEGCFLSPFDNEDAFAVIGAQIAASPNMGNARCIPGTAASAWDFASSPLAPPSGIMIAVGVGVFFGAYPAATAARLDPIETLRAE